MDNNLSIKKSLLENFKSLRQAILLNNSTSFIEEKVVDHYHQDLKKAQEVFDCREELSENFITKKEEQIEEGDTRISGFNEDNTYISTNGNISLQPLSNRIYNKTIFLKKLFKVIILLENEIKKAD